MSDKRRETRKTAIAFLGVYRGNTGEFIGYVLDLTSSGMRLKSLKEISPDSEFEFKMELPVEVADSTSVCFSAKSKWCTLCEENKRYYETGFEFVNHPSEEVAKIRELLKSKLFSENCEKLHISLSMMEH